MQDDQTLQTMVIDELAWVPNVDAAHIGVAAHDGVVRADTAYDAPREIAGDLHDRVTAPGRVGERYQVAFVMLVGVVAKCGAKPA